MGIAPFEIYTKLIPKEVATIGIVSQPTPMGSTSGIVLECMAIFLKSHFPHSLVSIRNSSLETHSMIYTRLIKAKMTFCTSSTYCLWPTLAAEGKRVLLPSLLYGGQHPNWVDKLDGHGNGSIIVPLMEYFPSELWPKEDRGHELCQQRLKEVQKGQISI